MNSNFLVVDKACENEESPKVEMPPNLISIPVCESTKDAAVENFRMLLDSTFSSKAKMADNYSWNEDISKCSASFNSKNYIPKISIEGGTSAVLKKKSFTQKYINTIKQEDSSLNYNMIKSKFYKEMSDGCKSVASNSNQSYMGYLDNSIFNCLEIEGPNLNDMEMDKLRILHSPSTERNVIIKRQVDKKSPINKRNSLFLPVLPKSKKEVNDCDYLSNQDSFTSLKIVEHTQENLNTKSESRFSPSGLQKSIPKNLFEAPEMTGGNLQYADNLTSQFERQCLIQDSAKFSNLEYKNPIEGNDGFYGFHAANTYQPSQNLNSSYLQYMPSTVDSGNNFYYNNQNNENTNYNPSFVKPVTQSQYPVKPALQPTTGIGGTFQQMQGGYMINQMTNILQASKEQAGCRMLQKQIEESTEFANLILYPQIKPHIVEISIDQFGNYLIQRLFEKLLPDRINEISKIMMGSFKIVSTSQFGTRVIQKLIDYVENKETKAVIIQALKIHLILLANHSQGNHVISKILSKFGPDEIAPLNNIFLENLESIVKDKYGCCVIQKLIERSHEPFREIIITYLLNNVQKYILDPFANYVLQLSVTFNYRHLNFKILDYVKHNFLYFALEKYSSNVIEKSLSFCTDDIRNEIIDIIQKSEEVTSKLLLDLYGNHILQKALTFANEKAKEKILDCIAKYVESLDKTTHGPKLKARLLSSFSYLNTLLGVESFTNKSQVQYPQLNKGKQFAGLPNVNPKIIQEGGNFNNYIAQPNLQNQYQVQYLNYGNQIPQLNYQPNTFGYQNQMYQPSPMYYPNMQNPYSNDLNSYKIGHNQMMYNHSLLPQQVYQNYPYTNYEYPPMYVGNPQEGYYLNSK